MAKERVVTGVHASRRCILSCYDTALRGFDFCLIGLRLAKEAVHTSDPSVGQAPSVALLSLFILCVPRAAHLGPLLRGCPPFMSDFPRTPAKLCLENLWKLGLKLSCISSHLCRAPNPLRNGSFFCFNFQYLLVILSV